MFEFSITQVSASSTRYMEDAELISFGDAKSGNGLSFGWYKELLGYYKTFFFEVPFKMDVSFTVIGNGTDPFNVDLDNSAGKYVFWGFGENSKWSYNPYTKKSTMKEKRSLEKGIYYITLVDYLRDGDASWSITINGSISSKPNIKSLKKTSKTSVLLQWKRVNGASGYQVYMKKGSGKFKLIKNLSSTKLKKKGLKKGKTYQFKIRAYRLINGTIIYSPFVIKSIKL